MSDTSQAESTTPDPGLDQHAMAARTLRWSLPFTTWPDEAIDALAKAGRIAHYTRRTQVMAHELARREVMVVVAGVLEISRSSVDGKKFVLHFVGPGQAHGLVRLLDTVPRLFEYYAHEDTVLLQVPCAKILQVLDTNPELWREVAKLTLTRQWDLIGTLCDSSLASLGQRLVNLLASLARLHGVKNDSGISLRLRLSQDDLGAILGVARQSVAKELRELESDGLIDTSYNHIVVRDFEALSRRSTRVSSSGL